MDTKDARAVIKILAQADGGCPYCVRDLITLFVKEYPGFYRWEIYDWIKEIDPALAEGLEKAQAV